MKLPRQWQGFLVFVVCLSLTHKSFAQAVSLIRSSHNAGAPSLISPARSGQAHSVFSFFSDEIVLSQLGHISSFSAPALTHTASSAPDLIYRPKSLAVTQPNINPFFATSINPLTTSASYIQGSSSSTSSASTVMSSTNAIPVSRLGLAYRPSSSSSDLASAWRASASPSKAFLGMGSLVSTPPRTGAIANFSFATMAGVPEPTSLVLGLAVFLMIGYGWLRRRWTQDDQSLEDNEGLLAAKESAAVDENVAA